MKIGVIGTGWGLMHVGAFRAAGAEVHALCGRDAVKTRALAAREGIPLSTTDVHELCGAVEAVVVASSDGMHHAHVLAALGAGRHVLCEKPLASTLTEARELVAAADAAPSLRAVVGFPYRQLPPLKGLRAWLANRSPVRELDVVLRSSFISREGGQEGSADFGGASHVIDAALWLSGAEPEWVQAAFERHSLSLHVGLSGGARLTVSHRPTSEPGIHGSWAIAGDDWEAGFFAGFQPALHGWRVSAPRAFVDGRWRDVVSGVEPRAGEREPWAEAHVAGARLFLTGEGGLATFRDGTRVQAVLDAAKASQRSNSRHSLRG